MASSRRPRQRCCRATAEAASTDAWPDFSRRASGEWEGVTATFQPSGEPVELPPQYVPSEYREWEMHLYDWQTQCSSLAEDGRLLRGVKRLMPTVGCEADAVAFTQEQQVSKMESDGDRLGAVFLADGSYSIPADFSARGATQAEHCFATGDGQRTRVVHLFRDLATGWTLSAIEVHRERREADYNGGKELAGGLPRPPSCGGGMAPFSEKPRLAAEALEGRWAPVADSSVAEGRQLQSEGPAAPAVTLPLDSWSRCQQTDCGWSLEAGCQLSEQEHYVSRHRYEDGCLVSISLDRQQRAQ